MKTQLWTLALLCNLLFWNCNSRQNPFKPSQALDTSKAEKISKSSEFKYAAEQFADLRVLRYQVKGFESLNLNTRKLLFYLYQAALCGRDITWDQNYRYNLAVRKTLEAIFSNPGHDTASAEFQKLETYAKRVWFSNGIHHHYNHDKIIPECSVDFFKHVLSHLDASKLPLKPGQNLKDFTDFITRVVFDPTMDAKRVSLDAKKDMLQTSAVNFYRGVSQSEAEAYYQKLTASTPSHCPSYGINSRLIKQPDGSLSEQVWKLNGLYHAAIEKIIYWLQKATEVCENDAQKKSLEALIQFYKTGNPSDFDAYNIAWVRDTSSTVDVVNGFIEVYQDPLGKKGSFESVVSVKDPEASQRISKIGSQAQWFEDHSPILPQHKKSQVKGISAKVILAVVESGDAAPSTPIGINLPNNEWIREEHGSKSVNLGNIVEAYEGAAGNSVIQEFYYSDSVQYRVKTYASLADKLHTDMHEVIGHASGKLESGVAPSSETLKNYANALEEARADLVALYYLLDPKLVELGVMPSIDYGKAAYDEYITKGLLIQLARIKPGQNLEEAHMRNRKLIAEWCYQKGKNTGVIEQRVVNQKTYYIIQQYAALRELFGQLLKEIQRIKSQGDYKAAQGLVETYGVKLNPNLHREVLRRYETLKIAPYAGFIQPQLIPVYKGNQIIDVKIEYPEQFKSQMMYYGSHYSFLPAYND
mgnify:FL=1